MNQEMVKVQEDKTVIPIGWLEISVGKIAKLIRGVTYDKSAVTNTYKDGYIPIIRATNIQDEKLILDKELVYVPKTYVKQEQLLEVGDIVFCMSSGSKHLVGKTAQLSHSWKGSFGTFCAVARFSHNVNPKFAAYFFASSRYRHFIQEKSSGVNINNLRQSDIESIQFPIPSIDEQDLIVAEIEKQFTRLDAAVAALKRAQANLKRYKASVLKAACKGKLVPQDPNDEPASVLLQRILVERRAKWEEAQLEKFRAQGKMPKDDTWKQKYEEPKEPDTTGLPELPEGWCWASVEQLATVGTGATPLRNNSHYYQNGDIPWVTSGALNDLFITQSEECITQLALKDTNAKLFPVGTLLIAMYGEGKTRGKVSELKINAATNQACAALLFDGLAEKCKPYIKIYFRKNYDDIRFMSSGGVQPNLNLSIIKQTYIPLPPFTEQKRITSEIDKRLSLTEFFELNIKANLARSLRLRQTLLKYAFSGKLIRQNSGVSSNDIEIVPINIRKESKSIQSRLEGF